MNNISYVYQKFYEALEFLVFEGKLQDRLARTFWSLNTLREDDFPDDDRLRDRFFALMPKLELLAAPREKLLSIPEIEDLSRAKEEAENLAEEILSIFADLARRPASPSS
jgi:hypothetical protein